MTELKFEWEHDDLCMVFLDGQFIGPVDYDGYGRSGMSAVLNMLENIAEAQGWEVVVEGTPGV